MGIVRDLRSCEFEVSKIESIGLPYVVICFLGENFIPETPDGILTQPKEFSKLKISFNKALISGKIKPNNVNWFAQGKIAYAIVSGLDEPQVNSLMESCSANIKKTISYTVTMASGKIIHDVHNLEDGIRSCLSFAEYARFVQNKFDIINHLVVKEIQENIFKQYPFFEIENYERSLINAVFQGDFIVAKVITNHFFISHLMRDIETFKRLRENIYNILRFAVALTFKSPYMFYVKDDIKEAIWQRVLKSEKLEDMQHVINDFYDLLYDCAKPMKNFNTQLLKIQPIIDYIKENYSNPLICENQICEKFNISVSHLSRIFKEQSGMSFAAYIQALRIEKAKHLIITTGDSMDTIAKNIGYSSNESMYKMFKRIEGISPSQFKRNYFKIVYDKSTPNA
jgi:YesN/AraC family two-component response regulator